MEAYKISNETREEKKEAMNKATHTKQLQI